MKLAIIGSRGIDSVDLSQYIPDGVDTIISGGARGVDTLAAEYARSHGIALVEYLPDYARFGRSAPLKRNHTIIADADCVLALWDGKSRGTAYTIRIARDAGKPVNVVTLPGCISQSRK